MMKVKELKGLCKKHKIKRYSKLSKCQLVDIIYDKYIELYDIQKLKKYNTIYENINFAFNDLHSTIHTTLVEDEKINYYRDTYDIEDAITYIENGDNNGRYRCAISMNNNLTYDILVKYKDSFEDLFGSDLWWYNISAHYPYLCIDFIEEFKDSINWGQLATNYNLTDEIIIKYQDKFCWTKLTRNASLSLEVIDKYMNNIDNMKTKNQEIEDNFMRLSEDNFTKHIHKVVWYNILLKNSNLNVGFISKYLDVMGDDVDLKNLLKNPYAPDNIKQMVCEVENIDDLNLNKKYMTIDTYIRDDIDRNDIDCYNENDLLSCENIDKYKDVLNWNELTLDAFIPYNIFSYIIINYSHKLIDIVIGNKRFKEFCSNVNYHNSYAYKRQQQRKQMKIIEEELIETAWHPNRVFRWCFTECEKIDIENNFTN